MEILKSYSLGTKLRRPIQRFWSQKAVVPKAERCYSGPSKTGRGVIQGDPISPKVFNIVVNTVIGVMLLELCGPQEAQNGLGWVAGRKNIIFYADDGRIMGRKSIWVQKMLTVIEHIFVRVGLQTNLGKTKLIICIPGCILGQKGEAQYKRQVTGGGGTSMERNQTRVSCEVCGVTMAE